MSSVQIHHIIEQHAEETAFLWLLRSYSTHAPHYRLKDLVKLDQRVEAHLDGLRLAGPTGWNLCEQALQIGEAGEVFTATLLALESNDVHKLTRVINIAVASTEATKGLISAFGWTDRSKLGGMVKYLLDSDVSFNQLIGLAACAAHREYPGQILEKLLRDQTASVPLLARALRTVGELKRRELSYELSLCLQHEHPAIRFWAAWSSVLLGNRAEALEVLKSFVIASVRQIPSALPALLRALPLADAHQFLKGLAQYPERLRDVIVGAGIVGDPFYIPWLIKQMEAPELARVAGESFCLITGVDIDYLDLDGKPPEGFESGPSEKPADDNVALDSDGELSWPDAHKVHNWWQARAPQFQNGIRYLLGVPITQAQCRNVLRNGFQRQRAAAALELALLNTDETLFETRAPGWRQQQVLQSQI